MVARGPQGELIGTGFYREGPRVAWRRFRRDIGDFDIAYVQNALHSALSKREEQPSRRLIWAEADAMPGLVLDQYGKHLVAQVTTLGMEKHWEIVRAEVDKILKPEGIWLRRDAAGRKLEGLENLPGEAFGNVPEKPVRVQIANLEVPVDLRGGQKTGGYLDQQKNYELVAHEANGRNVLDLFCHNGGFALRSAKAGAKMVTGVDTSGPSLQLAKQASGWHGLKVRWIEEDVSRFLRSSRKGEYDLVILDPPGMVKGREGLEAGLRAMGELHRQALRVLASGGLLATFSCSHRVGREELLGMARQVAHEEGRRVNPRSVLSQAADHPVDPSCPESQYLSGFLLEVT